MKITKVPVINPDFVAEVKFSPTVCVAKPEKFKSPRIIPPAIASREALLMRETAKGNRIKAAIVNRSDTKRRGETFVRDIFIMTKVTPHNSAVNNNAPSAVNLFIVNF